MRKGKTPATLQREVDEFNALVKIGEPVEYVSVKGDTNWQRFNTRTEAQILSGHTAVVWLEGKSGCVCIDHCRKASS